MTLTTRTLAIALLFSLAACSGPTPPAPTTETAPATGAEAAPVDVPAGEYTLDRSHASLIFRVDHLGFSNYTARFRHFEATLQFDPMHLANSAVTATVDPRSLETDFPDPATLDFNAQLQGEPWLDSAQFPEMTYRSTGIEVTGPRTMKISGELTLRGITRPVTLEAKFNGGYAGHPMDPHARIGFSAHGALRRSEFGMTYGIPEAGTKMGVSDAVQIAIEAEFSGPAWTAPPQDQPATHP